MKRMLSPAGIRLHYRQPVVRGVILDRDGTLNVEKGYVHRPDDIEFIPGAVEAIRIMNAKGYLVFVATNQAGVAKGFYGEEDVKALHAWMDEELRKQGALLSGISYCPHHPDSNISRYRRRCMCRKPNPGMLNRIMMSHGIIPGMSYTIGDKESDLMAGKMAGTRTILVQTGYGREQPVRYADYIVRDLLSAARDILP